VRHGTPGRFANLGNAELRYPSAKSVAVPFATVCRVQDSSELYGSTPPDRSLRQPDAVHTPLTPVRRNAGIVLLLVTVSACARAIHPASPPQTPPPQVPPPQTAPPEAPPQGPTAQAPARPAGPLVFTATAYCTGSVTASGIPVSKGMVAADPAVLPLGTRIRITRAAPYNGTYWVLDTGGAIRKRRLDLYIPDCAAARQFGRRSVHVTVISSRR
jgi:3D (Asp-Asp-Asp) domain-containing protein